MIAGRWFITPHAVRRYIERVDRTADYDTALAYLVAQSDVAHPVKQIEPGLWLYRGTKPRRLRFRVSTIGAGLPQLVTVLGASDLC